MYERAKIVNTKNKITTTKNRKSIAVVGTIELIAYYNNIT